MASTLTPDVVQDTATRKGRHYIYPPRAVTAIPKEDLKVLADRGWLAQLKFNDTHILLDYDGPHFVKAWDRHGKTPAYDFGALQEDLNALGHKLVAWNGDGSGDGRYLLDGGLLHSKHAAIKHVLVIWDVLVKGDTHLLGTTYRERHHDLGHLCSQDRYQFKGQDLGALITPRCFRPDNYWPWRDWDRAWEIVARVNEGYEQPLLEGLMLKNPLGRLRSGFVEKNNSDWLTRSRVKTGRHLF